MTEGADGPSTTPAAEQATPPDDENDDLAEEEQVEADLNLLLLQTNGGTGPKLANTRPEEHCEGVDIVQSDHAPEAGVAQGIFHGDLIRHQGGHQEELEEELEEEVERRVKREHSRNQTQVRMHG